MLTAAGCCWTLSVAEPVIPWAAARMVVEPFVRVVATPESSTVATVGAVEVQLNVTPDTIPPDSVLAVAENGTVCPTDPAPEVVGSTRMEEIVGADEKGSPPPQDTSPAVANASPSRATCCPSRAADCRTAEDARARATAKVGMDK
jgi:hypothetical protein